MPAQLRWAVEMAVQDFVCSAHPAGVIFGSGMSERLPEDVARLGARRALLLSTDALYGAWLCGICLGSVGTALHHKLCHVPGGCFDLPHAETHTIMLPHALAHAGVLPLVERRRPT